MRYLSAGLLEQFQGLYNEVAQVAALALVVLDFVADVGIAVSEDVEDGQNLAVVGYQGFTDHVPAQHQLLDHLQHGSHDVGVPGIQCGCVRQGVLLMGMMS